MSEHNVELFVADCRLCEMTENTLQILNDNKNIEYTVHRASECVDGSCCEIAEKYGIYAVPSLVVDGKLVKVGKITNIDEINEYLN